MGKVVKDWGEIEETSDGRRGKPAGSIRGYGFNFTVIPVKTGSVRQTRTTFSTASLQNFSAVGGFHSFTEAVNLASLALFRLVRSKHFFTLLTDIGK